MLVSSVYSDLEALWCKLCVRSVSVLAVGGARGAALAFLSDHQGLCRIQRPTVEFRLKLLAPEWRMAYAQQNNLSTIAADCNSQTARFLADAQPGETSGRRD